MKQESYDPTGTANLESPQAYSIVLIAMPLCGHI
jgi:hypothetical protein